MWIPRRLYEALPAFYILIGLVGIFVPRQPVVFAGLFCCSQATRLSTCVGNTARHLTLQVKSTRGRLNDDKPFWEWL